jgi:hypothetical protein
MIERVGYNSSLRFITFDSDHGMCFTASGLTVCENGTVVTFHDGFNERKSTFVIDTSLAGFLIVNSIIGEGSFGIAVAIFGSL